MRVIRTGKAAPTQEESYRVLVDEIADPRNTPKNGVAIQLRYSIPVFVAATASAPVKLSVTANRSGDQLHLKAVNSGNVHAQLSNLRLESGSGSPTPVTPGLLGYVLPANSREWTLAIPTNAASKTAPRRVRMTVNGQPFSVDF